MIKKLILIIALCSLIGAVFVHYQPARMVLSEFDYAHLGGAIFKLAGKDNGDVHSDLKLYQNAMIKADYRWVQDKPLWVAHALGGEGELANTEQAFLSSLDAGVEYFEVDIALVEGKLLCAHSLSEVKVNQDCTFDSLIQMAQNHAVWFILDVKSEFRATYRLITKQLTKTNVGHKFVPQMYRFNQIKYLDLDVFAGPLLTVYRMDQSSEFIVEVAEQLKLPVITLPLGKLAAPLPSFNGRLFSHDMRTINEYQKLKSLGVTGFYVKESLYHKIR